MTVRNTESQHAVYLLDTNILVHLVRANRLWESIRKQYNLLAHSPTPFISVVTVGEVRSLAFQYGWGESKLQQMEFCLGYFKVITIHDPAIIERYAAIDSHFVSRGHILGKNDLWVAATAAATGVCLLTTDRDFDPLTPDFLTREWINPDAVPTA
jgi:tRNA(fMet)-specific endonuclease VapC